MSLKLDSLWRTHQFVNDWIRFADTKATAVLGINSLLAGFAIANFAALRVAMQSNGLVLGSGILAGACLVGSAIFCLVCLRPTLKVRQQPSLFYYADIASRFSSGDAYSQASARMGDEAACGKELALQVWANSVVALRKYRAVTRAIWCLSGALALSILGFSVSILR